MKTCPYCAESDLQDAAVVCKHCGRELTAVAASVAAPPAATPPPATKTPKAKKSAGKGFLIVTVMVMILFGACGLFIWSNSSYSVDADAARRVVDSLEKDAVLTKRACTASSNSAVLQSAAWRQLGTGRLRENMMNALSRLCIDAGTGPRVTLFDEGGNVLAVFNGVSIER